MNLNILPLIQADELLHLSQSNAIIILDVRNGKQAKSDYEEKHLKGALFVDLNTQLADIKTDLSLGGRHPLPTIEAFTQTLSELGISKSSHVIVYDDKNGSNAAARLWWMLKSVGHEKVQVLNGGIQEAERIGFPLSAGVEQSLQVEAYEAHTWQLPTADINEVESLAQNDSYIVVDVRDANRYNGEIEPIDSIAGHIPGAINIPFSGNLAANGLFLSPSELKLKYEKAFGATNSEHIIVHCGSGVTACHTLLAIAYAGIPIPKLYVGSWSEWSRSNKPIATKTIN